MARQKVLYSKADNSDALLHFQDPDLSNAFTKNIRWCFSDKKKVSMLLIMEMVMPYGIDILVLKRIIFVVKKDFTLFHNNRDMTDMNSLIFKLFEL